MKKCPKCENKDISTGIYVAKSGRLYRIYLCEFCCECEIERQAGNARINGKVFEINVED